MIYKDAKEDKDVKVSDRDKETETSLELAYKESGGAVRG